MDNVGWCLDGGRSSNPTTRFWWERPEGLTLNNVKDKPVTVHSRNELRKLCNEENVSLPNVAGHTG